MYRFGDGTPFPFQQNFIDTLLAGVDACVGAFGAAAELEDRREKTRAARRDAEEELRRFAAMEKAIENAVAPMKPSADRTAHPSQQAASRALAAARTAIAQHRQAVEGRITQLAGEPQLDRTVERLRAAMAQFFERHQLPETSWSMSWIWNGATALGDATSISGRFRATFELQLAPPWNGVPRIGALVPGLVVTVPKRKMFGGWKRARVSLDRAGVVAIERSHDLHVLVIRALAGRPSPGWRLVFEGDDRVALVPVDLTMRPCGNAIELEGEAAAPLHALWETVEAALIEMVGTARTLRELAVGDATLDAMIDPSMVARTILGVLGPVVRQIRSRSRVPGELAIKRDIGDGRREELYVPREIIERKFATLPQAYRRPFEDIGLGRASTAEIVSADDAVTIPEPPHREIKKGPPPPPPAHASHSAHGAHAAPPLAAPPLAAPIIKAEERKGEILAKLPKVPPTLPRVPIPIDDGHSGGVAA